MMFPHFRKFNLLDFEFVFTKILMKQDLFMRFSKILYTA